MNTIRITAMRTEKARSRIQERVLQTFGRPGASTAGSTAAAAAVAFSFSSIPRYTIIDGWPRPGLRLLYQRSQQGERHGALRQGFVVELGELIGGALRLPVGLARRQPAAP